MRSRVQTGARAAAAALSLLVVVLAALVAIGGAEAKKKPPKFKATKSHAVGSNPANLASADFDGDGRVDIVTADFGGGMNSLPSGISILRSKGKKSFAKVVRMDFGSQVWDVASTRLPGDKDPDLIVASYSTGSLIVLHGEAGAGFGNVETVPVTSSVVRDLELADFNADGLDDAAVVVEGEGIAVLRGMANGSFAAPVALPSPGPGVEFGSLAATRLNKDKRPDLVATRNDGSLSTWLAKPGFTFTNPVPTFVGMELTDIVAGDFDGDRRNDIAASRALPTPNARGIDVAEDQVIVLRGNGKGALRPASKRKVGNTPLLINSLAAGDFNRDGRDDVVAGYDRAAQVALLRGRKKGKLTRPFFVAAKGATTQGVIATRLNKDKRLDIATSGRPLKPSPNGRVNALIQKKPKKKRKR